MHAHPETSSWQAFELVADALGVIDQYRRSRNVDVLKCARSKLASALQRDPSYVRARFYEAIVDDLAGEPKKAAQTLKGLLDERPPFANEVSYNLGVAEYHSYGHEALDRAIGAFSVVADKSHDLSLQLHAQAGLAQAHAMHMIPKDPAQPDLQSIQRHFDKAMKASSDVLGAVRRDRWAWLRLRKPVLTEDSAREIAWTAHNARGMALMYYSDYLPELKNKQKPAQIAMLRDALNALEVAESISPLNWANYCDMASARMRIGHHGTDKAQFDAALKLLGKVIESLRPGYPFAMYEMGRIRRVMGEIDPAVELFKKVLLVPEKDRDVSDRRVNIEIDRAKERDSSFP